MRGGGICASGVRTSSVAGLVETCGVGLGLGLALGLGLGVGVAAPSENERRELVHVDPLPPSLRTRRNDSPAAFISITPGCEFSPANAIVPPGVLMAPSIGPKP